MQKIALFTDEFRVDPLSEGLLQGTVKIRFPIFSRHKECIMSTTLQPRASVLSHYPDVSARASAKELKSLDIHCRKFISLSPFCILSTASENATPDLTPRGGLPGFVVIENDTTLVIPDRPGNNRLDNLGNLAENPQVALLFMIPGVNETLRVRGTAEIVTDAA